MEYIIEGMIYLGSALMVFNIVGFIMFANKTKKRISWKYKNIVLYIPIVLLILFLVGYLAVGIFGHPDLIVSGILFGGSIFVFVMYLLLNTITKRLFEGEKLEAKLLASEESNKAKTEFLSGISHEMRTPLNVILGLNSLSLNDNQISNETRERLVKTEHSAKYLLSIINNILDMNSIETGQFNIKNEVFSLYGAVEQINMIISTLCLQKEIKFECVYENKLCEHYISDEMRIKQILLSILDNAVKYTNNKGNITLKIIQNKLDDNTNNITFIISDNGRGISEDFLPRVFDAFSKEDNSITSTHPGSGLGLAITKNIVNLLNGKIEVNSKIGEGTTFKVEIPLKVGNLNENNIGVDSLEGKRILIVEDIQENAEIVADLLELEGATSEHAINGKIAVEMVNNNEPYYYDAILMDLRMPVMDGITATREIRNLNKKDAKEIPIIALTANAFEQDVKESIAAGMNAHLSKPADSDKLYATLKKYIRK